MVLCMHVSLFTSLLFWSGIQRSASLIAATLEVICQSCSNLLLCVLHNLDLLDSNLFGRSIALLAKAERI